MPSDLPTPPRSHSRSAAPAPVASAEPVQGPPLSAVTVIPESIQIGITGLGSAFPEEQMSAQDFEDFALRHYPPTPALLKTLQINCSTLITNRSIANPLTSAHLSSPNLPPIEEAFNLFLSSGVALGAQAARLALADAQLPLSSITHLVCVTVCCSSNPGWDLHLAQSLGLPLHIPRTLLHGVGCLGGLSLLRQATALALASHVLEREANILCVAAETPSLFYRHALEGIHKTGEVRPAVTLFGDGAAAMVVSTPAPGSTLPSSPEPSLSSPVAETQQEVDEEDKDLKQKKKKVHYLLRALTQLTLPNSIPDLAVPLSSTGFDALLSRRVPALTSSTVLPVLGALQTALGGERTEPGELDWALHPGGAAVLSAVQKVAHVPRERVRASWEVYGERGNCASATVLAILQRMSQWEDGRKEVLATAFGPGVGVEMVMLHRL